MRPQPPAPIGVFDSGIGGLSILRALQAELPNERFVYLSDSAHAPYGERGDAFVNDRCFAVTQQLREQHGIKALVIACNTATAAAIHNLRTAHPDLPVIGIEPAVKPAVALSQTKHIGVMVTRGTAYSTKFQTLLSHLQAQSQEPIRFTVQACDGLAAAIESQNATKIRALLADYTSAMGRFGNQKNDMDTLVLGCTHYALAIAPLRTLVGNVVQVVDNGPAVARQTRRLLASGHQLAPGGDPCDKAEQTNAGTLQLLATGDSSTLVNAASHWL